MFLTIQITDCCIQILDFIVNICEVKLHSKVHLAAILTTVSTSVD